MEIFNFELEEDDMNKLMSLNCDHRAYTFHRAVDCKDYPFWRNDFISLAAIQKWQIIFDIEFVEFFS